MGLNSCANLAISETRFPSPCPLAAQPITSAAATSFSSMVGDKTEHTRARARSLRPPTLPSPQGRAVTDSGHLEPACIFQSEARSHLFSDTKVPPVGPAPGLMRRWWGRAGASTTRGTQATFSKNDLCPALPK